jgi:hypothetical protein
VTKKRTFEPVALELELPTKVAAIRVRGNIRQALRTAQAKMLTASYEAASFPLAFPRNSARTRRSMHVEDLEPLDKGVEIRR